MTSEQREAIRQACEQATPGPWEVGGPYPGVSVIVMVDPGSAGPDPFPPEYQAIAILDQKQNGKPDAEATANAELIVLLRNHAEALLSALEGAERERGDWQRAAQHVGVRRKADEYEQEITALRRDRDEARRLIAESATIRREVEELTRTLLAQRDAAERELAEVRGAAQSDVMELSAQLAEAQANNRRTVCSYCGHVEEFPEGTSQEDKTSQIAAHIEACVQHPLSEAAHRVVAAEARVTALTAALEPFVAYFSEFIEAEKGQDFSNWDANAQPVSDFGQFISNSLQRARAALAPTGQATVECLLPDFMEDDSPRCVIHDDRCDWVECTGWRCPVSGQIVTKRAKPTGQATDEATHEG